MTAAPAPRITLAVLAYEQAGFIEDAVRSALAQECEPVEVLLSDDASRDDTYARMQALAEAYRGPHQVVLRRNPRNLGVGAHYNALVEAARGRLIVTLAGDDISLPGRVAAMARAWDASGEKLDLLACDLIDMGHDGREHGTITVDDLAEWPDVDAWVRRRPYIVGAGHAFTRRLFERFGPLCDGVAYEDQILTLRAIASGGAATVREPLVRYRRGGLSGAAREFTGAHFVAWTQRRNLQALALHAQWLDDARTAGCLAVVEQATQHEHARQIFMRDLLDAGSTGERIRVVRAARSISLDWRLRRLLYWQWPALAAGVQRLQAWSRERRR